MAPLPRPIGIDATLVDIATGLGKAARLLPSLSRSDLGAVALKTAKVRIDFDMARAAAKTSNDVELGIRTFAIGGNLTRSATAENSRSTGSIELEIVAVAEIERSAAPVPAATPTPPVRDPRREAIANAIKLLRSRQALAGLDAATRRRLQAAVKRVETAVDKGELDKAADELAKIPAMLPPGHSLNQPDG
ncbi:MAG: hypothetical protein ACOYLS_11175 [Polymorphobacter sp.]